MLSIKRSLSGFLLVQTFIFRNRFICRFQKSKLLSIGRFAKLFPGFGFSTFAFGPLFKSSKPQPEESPLQKHINEADKLYLDNKFPELYAHLKHLLDSGNQEFQHPEILWRLARAANEMAKVHDKDEELKRKYTNEAFGYARKGLDIDPKHWACNKWYGILLDYTAKFEGKKKRIQNAFLMKEHLLKAIEANPRDATTLHCLGVWCYEFANLAWYERKIAAMIFATPPQSTYEEALAHLLKAEEVEPNFYSQNLLCIGKCYHKMGDLKKARDYLERCANYKGCSFDDHQAKEEASTLLKGL